MKWRLMPIDLKLAREFVVAKGRTSGKRNHIIVLDEIGLGEASGSVHYGATSEEIKADLTMAMEKFPNSPDNNEYYAFMKEYEGQLCRPAQCALSTAWYDLQSKLNNEGLYKRFNLDRPGQCVTSVTASIGDNLELERLITSGYRFIKMKMDADKDESQRILDVIAGSEGVKYRIDANGSWDIEAAQEVVPRLPENKIELIEQPFLPENKDDWAELKKLTSIPLFMDESIITADDIKKAAGFIDGVNIKIQKSGQLETAAQAMRTARELGLKVMLGCMIESSIGIAAARQLSSLADYLDLDGSLLAENDPFIGLVYNKDVLEINNGYGHGVTLA